MALNSLFCADVLLSNYSLSSQGEFVPIAVESHSPVNNNAFQFLSELGSWQLVETTRDVRASSFLFQRISTVV